VAFQVERPARRRPSCCGVVLLLPRSGVWWF